MDDIYYITPIMVHQYATTDDVYAVVDFLRSRGHAVAVSIDAAATNMNFIRKYPQIYAAIQADWSEALDFAAKKNRWGLD